MLKLPSRTQTSPEQPSPLPSSMTSSRLMTCVGKLKELQSFILALSPSEFSRFARTDWSIYIVAVVLTVRLSFRIPDCPEWDFYWAREQLKSNEFLERLSRTENKESSISTRSFDVLAASKIVVGTVKEKYDKRVAASVAQANVPLPINFGCPMLDGSLQEYLPAWDSDFSGLTTSSSSVHEASGQISQHQDPLPPPKEIPNPAIFHDLWATMTMSWSSVDKDLIYDRMDF